MSGTAVISLFALVGTALAQFALQTPKVRGGAFAPQFMPEANPHIEVATKRAPALESPAYDSRAVSSSVATGGLSPEQLAFMQRQRAARGETSFSAAAPAAPSGAGGFSPEQLAFMQRQNAFRGGASTASRAAPSGYASLPVEDGFSPQFAPRYAPSFADGPSLDELNQASPNVVSILAAVLIGALAGAGVTFAIAIRRRVSTELKEPFIMLSN